MKSVRYLVFALVLLGPSACYDIIHEQRSLQYLRSHKATLTPIGPIKKETPASLVSSDGGLPTNLQVMEDEVERLIKHRKSTNFGTPFSNALTQIKGLLTTMEGQVNASHHNRQTTLNEACEEIAACGTTLDASLQAVPPVHSKYEAESLKHKSCRGEEAQKNHSYTECAADVLTKEGLGTTACSLSAQVSNNAKTGASQSLTQMSNENVETFLLRVQALVGGCNCDNSDVCVGSGGGLLDKVRCAREECEKATADHDTAKVACTTIMTDHESKQSLCDNIQDDMDAFACESAVLSNTACEKYSTCSADKEAAYATVKTHVQEAEITHKLEWRSLRRMGCLLSALELDANLHEAAITACKEKTHNANHLSIDYACDENAKTCSSTDLYPGTAAYHHAEFKVLPAGAKGKLVQPCPGVPGSPNSAPSQAMTATLPKATFGKWTLFQEASALDPFPSASRTPIIWSLAMDYTNDHLYILAGSRGVVYKCVGSSPPALFAGTPVEDPPRGIKGMGGDAKAAVLGETVGGSIAWHPDEKALYIVLWPEDAILKVASATGIISLFKSLSKNPKGAAIHDGILYVCAEHPHILHGIRLLDGDTVVKYAMDNNPYGSPAVNPATGDVYVETAKDLYMFDKMGTKSHPISISGIFYGATSDPVSGAIYVAAQVPGGGRIKTNADGSWKTIAVQDGLDGDGPFRRYSASDARFAIGMCVSASGVLYAGFYGGEVWMYGLRD